MFTNLAIIRRYYIDKWSDYIKNKKTTAEKNKTKTNE